MLFDLFLHHDFDGERLIADFVSAELHHSKGSLSKNLFKLISFFYFPDFLELLIVINMQGPFLFDSSFDSTYLFIAFFIVSR